jgi:uncharacterized delta-60 repeat protein
MVGLTRAAGWDEMVDRGYGQDGAAIASFGAGYEAANTTLVDAAYRLVMAGYAETPAYPGDFAIARFQPDGKLDLAWGGSGRVTTDFDGAPDTAWAIVQKPDGGYLVAGETCDALYEACQPAAAAYTDGGTLDPAFGGDGRAVLNTGLVSFAWARRAVIGPGDRLTTGNVVVQKDGDVDLALVRFTSDGKPDPGFGKSGVAVVDLEGSGDYPQSLRSVAGGKLLVAGALGEPVDRFSYQPEAAFIARFDGKGALDKGFGNGGYVIWKDEGKPVDGTALAVGADGSIYALGITGLGTSAIDCVLRRFSEDGQPVAGFGDGGRAVIDSGGGDYCYSLEILPDGKLAIMGRTIGESLDRARPNLAGRLGPALAGQANFDMLAARYFSSGLPDSSFSGDGMAIFAYGNKDNPGIDGSVQADGKIIVGGVLAQAGATDFLAVRFLAEAPPPPVGVVYLPVITHQ